MTTRVVSFDRPPDPGDTLLVDGKPHVVLFRLPKLPGRQPAVRVTPDLPCGACEQPLCYDAPARRWRCSGCRTRYDRTALFDLVTEHLQDGARAGKARREADRHGRQVARGAPGAAAVLLGAAADGGAAGKYDLIRRVDGPERRALKWALRNDGADPLSADRCREAAAALSLTPAALVTTP